MKFKEKDFVQRRDGSIKLLDKDVKNKFKWEWLEEKVDGGFFSDFFRKMKDPGFIFCILCEDKINYGSSGKKALINHAKRSSHMKKIKEKKVDKATQPPLAAMFRKLKKMEDGEAELKSSPLPYGAPENVSSVIPVDGIISSTPRVVSLADRQAHQEAMICTFIAEHSLPISLGSSIVSLAKELSKDYKALQGLKLERTSVTCKLKDGLSCVFHKRLVTAMKTTPFSINVDESTLKSNKKRVLNILVCYFCDKLGRSVTHLYASIEMSVVNAETVYNAVVKRMREDAIPFSNLVSVLSDSAAYMRGRHTGFQVRLKEDIPTLLDIDGDCCHHLHNIVKTFCSNLDPGHYLTKLLGDIHNDFALSADLREDLKELATLLFKPPLVPVEFAGHRWLSILHSTTRLLEIIDQATIFYFAWVPQNKKQDYSPLISDLMKGVPSGNRANIYNVLRRLKHKNMTVYGKARKARIQIKLFDTRAKTLFISNVVKSVLPMFTQCILLLEKNTPQVHKLYDRTLETFTQFLACYIKSEVLDGERRNVKEIDFSNEANFLPGKQMFVGAEGNNHLLKLKEKDRKDLLGCVKTAYKTTGVYMRSKLPLENKIIIALSSLDPLARKHAPTKNKMRQLNQLVHLPESDEFLVQLNSYHIDNDILAPENSAEVELDLFWAPVIKKYPALSPLIKTCLSLFTGPKVEQSFSMLNMVLDPTANRMAISTAEAYQRVKYVLLAEKTTAVELLFRRDIIHDPVDLAICHHIQTARSRSNRKAIEQQTKKEASTSRLEVADSHRQELVKKGLKRKGDSLSRPGR